MATSGLHPSDVPAVSREPVTVNSVADSAGLDASLILLIGEPRGVVRRLEPVLLRRGYVVSTADDSSLPQDASGNGPDAILLDAHLPSGSSIDACRMLRHKYALPPGPAIVVVAATTPSRAERIAALQAGAADCVGLDEEELLLRLAVLLRAKLAAERMQSEGQFDATTGLYNLHGLMQRAQELAALMVRQHGPLSCLLIAMELESRALLPTSASRRLAQSVFHAGRRSDVRARIGETEFAVLAPGTDGVGALGLAQRLARAAREAVERMGLSAQIRVGYEAIPNFGYEPLDPVVLLQRARAALHDDRGEPDRGITGIRRFQAPGPGVK